MSHLSHLPQSSERDTSRRRSARCRPGFTFIEVLIVVLVLAIAGALAGSTFSRTNDTQLRAAARMLAADLDHARIASITHADEARVVVFDQANDQYHIAKASSTDTPVTNPATRQDYVTDFGQRRAASLDDVSIASHSLDGDNELAFGIYGELDQGDPATITLAAGSRRITITVDPVSGKTSIGDITSP